VKGPFGSSGDPDAPAHRDLVMGHPCRTQLGIRWCHRARDGGILAIDVPRSDTAEGLGDSESFPPGWTLQPTVDRLATLQPAGAVSFRSGTDPKTLLGLKLVSLLQQSAQIPAECGRLIAHLQFLISRDGVTRRRRALPRGRLRLAPAPVTSTRLRTLCPRCLNAGIEKRWSRSVPNMASRTAQAAPAPRGAQLRGPRKVQKQISLPG
jgi:hypothetical protein